MRPHTGHCCRLWKLCWFLSFGMYRVVPNVAHKHLQSNLGHTVNQVETLSCLTGKKPWWEILAVWILCGTLHVLMSWLDILMELLYFRRFRRNVTSTQTINVLCGSRVSSRLSQTFFYLSHLHADFFHCVATAFSIDEAAGMTYCGEHRNFPSYFTMLSAAGLSSVLDCSIFVEMLVLILGWNRCFRQKLGKT